MNQTRVYRGIRAVGDVAWWIFLASSLLAGSVRWFHHPTRDFGWFAGSPSTYAPGRYATYAYSSDLVVTDNVNTAVELMSLVAFCVTAVVAVAVAIQVRSVSAAVAVIALAAAWGLMSLVLPGWGTLALRPWVGAVVVALAIAVREIATRGVRPRPPALDYPAA